MGQGGLDRLLAKDAMVSEVISISRTSTIREAIQLLLEHHISGLPVMDENDQLVGVIGERAIILAFDLIGEDISVEAIMNDHPQSVRPDQPLIDVFEMFREQGLRRLVVVDHERRLTGIIGRSDLLRFHMRNCLEANQFQRDTMRPQSSNFELGPLPAQIQDVA
jgi:CBS domain-containing protein